MIRVFTEPAVDRVTRIADCNVSDEEVSQEIDQGRHSEGPHGGYGLTSGKEVQACRNAGDHDRYAHVTIEVLLCVQVIVPAGRASRDNPAVDDRIIHKHGDIRIAIGAADVFG